MARKDLSMSRRETDSAVMACKDIELAVVLGCRGLQNEQQGDLL